MLDLIIMIQKNGVKTNSSNGYTFKMNKLLKEYLKIILV